MGLEGLVGAVDGDWEPEVRCLPPGFAPAWRAFDLLLGAARGNRDGAWSPRAKVQPMCHRPLNCTPGVCSDGFRPTQWVESSPQEERGFRQHSQRRAGLVSSKSVKLGKLPITILLIFTLLCK